MMSTFNRSRLRRVIGEQTVTSFAKALGVTRQIVHLWLSGGCEPDRENLFALASVAGRKPDWFYQTDADDPNAVA